MPLATVRQFVDVLQQSYLLSSVQLEALKSELVHEPDLQDQDVLVLGDRLVEEGKLTPFQVVHVINEGVAPTIGPYTLIDLIGEGGMGKVYLAENPFLKRRVAVKAINPDMAARHKTAVDRFRREMVTLGKLKHPNIIDALDAGKTADGQLYLVLEYVDGKDLHKLVAEGGPLAWTDACKYIRQAAEGLGFAHSKGILHRDIKPSNLILSKNGVLKVLDLGLALLAPEQGRRRLTVLGTIMGTATFMSPEQALDASKVDHRSDIYSLGCTFYSLLVGHPPFVPGTDMTPHEAVPQLLMQQQFESPAPLEQLRSDLPEALCQLVAKMLDKDPANRFQSYSDLTKDLDELITPTAQLLSSSPAVAVPVPEAVALTEEPVLGVALPEVSVAELLPEPVLAEALPEPITAELLPEGLLPDREL